MRSIMPIKFNTLEIPSNNDKIVRRISVLNKAHVVAWCANDDITIIRILDGDMKIIDTFDSAGLRVGDVAMSHDSLYLAVSYPDINLGRGATKLLKYSQTYGKYLQIHEIYNDYPDITMTRSGHSLAFIDVGEVLDLYITSESYIFNHVTITPDSVSVKVMRTNIPGVQFITNINASPLIPCISHAVKDGYGDLHFGDKSVTIAKMRHAPKDTVSIEAIGRHRYCFTTPSKLIVGGLDMYDTFNIKKLINDQIKHKLKNNPPPFGVSVPDVHILDMVYRVGDRRLIVLHDHPLTRERTLGITHLSDMDTQGHPPLSPVDVPAVTNMSPDNTINAIAQIDGKILVASHRYCGGTPIVSYNIES